MLIDDVVLSIIPLTICCIIIFQIHEIFKDMTIGKMLKLILCNVITTSIIISIFIVMVLNVYQVAVIWNDYEINHVLDPRVKTLSFVAVELIWQLITVALLFLLWRFVYYPQIIPGNGSLKMRLKIYLKGAKKSWMMKTS